MKKKILSLFLALVMVLSVALPAQAAETETTAWEAADFIYSEISENLYPASDTSDITTYSGIAVAGFSESGQEKVAVNPNVVLPSKDTEGNPVMGVSKNAFYKSGTTGLIETVTLPEDAENWVIQASAFQKNQITSVDLSGVVYVGNNAFKTNKLTSVKFNENIWAIYNGAFAQNSLTSVDFPEATTHALQLDNMAFAVNQLTTLRIPNNIEKMHKWTFLQNTGVETVVSSGTSAEKKGGVVYLYTNKLGTWDAPYIDIIGDGSNVQRLIYEGPVTEAEGRTYASGTDTLAAVKAGTGIVLDVRAKEKNTDLYLTGSVHQPLFKITDGKQSVTDLKDQLAFDFFAFVNGNADLKGKDIYVLCNSGSRGADAATKLLLSAGYAMEDIITIKNGAKDNDIIAAFTVRPTKTTGESRTVTGEQAVAAVDSKEVAIIDVRAKEKFAVGHLKNSVNLPLFTIHPESGSNVAMKDYSGELAAAFTSYVTENKESLSAKDIYLVCNAGALGANNGAKLLSLAGYDLDKVYTITGGATDSTMKANFDYVTGAQAVSVIEDKDNYLIIDVRATGVHATGHLKNSVSLPLFGEGNAPTTLEDEMASNFLAYINNADNKVANKTVYILCNSGARGVVNAFTLCEQAGLDMSKVKGISGGAKDAVIKDNLDFVTGAQAVSVIEDKDNYLIIDVRATGVHATGHLKNSVNLPLFGEGNAPTTLEDEMASNFLAYVQNADNKVADKTVYILCNSGARGVVNAFALFEQAGLDMSKVKGISGGAKDAVIKDNLDFVTGAQAVSVIEDTENYLIIDVRAEDVHKAGYLKNSVNLPLFGEGNAPTTLEDEMASNFLAYINNADNKVADKTVYILCNSGARGVVNAFALFEQAGLDLSKVKGISGGAKDETVKANFNVEKITITGKASYKKLTYNGKSRIPAVTLTDNNGNKLIKGTDYTTAVYNVKGNKVTSPKAVGKYTIKVTFKDNYAGSEDMSFTYSIVPKAVTNLKATLVANNGYDDVKLTWTKSTGATGYYVYYKKSTTASYSTKYRKAVTTNTVTIKNLSDGVKYNFKVVPYYGSEKITATGYTTVSKTTLKKVNGVKVSRTGKKAKVSWTNINGETGYQISRSTKKTGTNVVLTKANASLKTTTLTLSKAKKYYYKVRAYKVENGKKVYGPWSAVVYK